jgi:hypothetical protein
LAIRVKVTAHLFFSTNFIGAEKLAHRPVAAGQPRVSPPDTRHSGYQPGNFYKTRKSYFSESIQPHIIDGTPLIGLRPPL